MNKKLLMSLIMCSIVISICIAKGNNQQQEENNIFVELKQNINALHSKDDEDREKANKIILNNYDQIINELIKLVEVKLEPEPSIEVQKAEDGKYYAKEQAIMLLGYLRAAKAVPVLMENLEFKNPFVLGPISYTSVGNLYKTAGSLVNIGMPAVEPVLFQLKNFNKDGSIDKICCWIIKEILGVKLAKACIQIAIDETQVETEKKNLSEALTYIENSFNN